MRRMDVMKPIADLVLTGFVPRLFLGLLVLGIAVDTVIPLASAWLLVSFECLLSYSMLALTIGVVTQGVVNKR